MSISSDHKIMVRITVNNNKKGSEKQNEEINA